MLDLQWPSQIDRCSLFLLPLPEAVELAEGDAPGPAPHAVSVDRDVGAEVAPAEAFGPEKGHFRKLSCGFVWFLERD